MKLRRFFSLGQKLGFAFGALGLLLVAVCGSVVHHLSRMAQDAARVVEETREADVASNLVAAIHGAQICLDAVPRLTPADTALFRSRAQEYVTSARELLAKLRRGAGAGDPSTIAHESDEQRLFAGIEAGLLAPDMPRAGAGLAEAERIAGAFAAETRNEAQEAHLDLEMRGTTAARAIFGLLAASALAFLAMSLLVSRGIVRPIHALREGADRFGDGDLHHRITIRARDEIGALASAFNRMADRVTETQEQLEERVRAKTREFVRAAKLADMGVLAAGFAHEINTPLASIASSAEGLERRLRKGQVSVAEEGEYLRTIAAEAYRAREITDRLMQFAHQDPGPKQGLDVHGLLAEVERIVRHLLEKKELRLVLECAPDLPELRGNPAELKQALLNLVLTARDASPPQGTIWLRASREGDTVVLEVEDRGRGIAAEHLDRVFDPFFTTKPVGQGTGLGLSLAYAIAQGHGGTLTVQSEPQRGARFRLVLPIQRVEAP